MLAATLASLRINNLHVFCAHSEHSTVIMLSDCWLKWQVSCVWYYLYMAILHAHVPSFVPASRCMAFSALSHVPSFVSASHRLALDWYSIVGLSITSPGSHVPQHRWYQHHVSRLALMLALIGFTGIRQGNDMSLLFLLISEPLSVDSCSERGATWDSTVASVCLAGIQTLSPGCKSGSLLTPWCWSKFFCLSLFCLSLARTFSASGTLGVLCFWVVGSYSVVHSTRFIRSSHAGL